MVESVSWKPILWHGLGGAAKKIFSASSLGLDELRTFLSRLPEVQTVYWVELVRGTTECNGVSAVLCSHFWLKFRALHQTTVAVLWLQFWLKFRASHQTTVWCILANLRTVVIAIRCKRCDSLAVTLPLWTGKASYSLPDSVFPTIVWIIGTITSKKITCILTCIRINCWLHFLTSFLSFWWVPLMQLIIHMIDPEVQVHRTHKKRKVVIGKTCNQTGISPFWSSPSRTGHWPTNGLQTMTATMLYCTNLFI